MYNTNLIQLPNSSIANLLSQELLDILEIDYFQVNRLGSRQFRLLTRYYLYNFQKEQVPNFLLVLLDAKLLSELGAISLVARNKLKVLLKLI